MINYRKLEDLNESSIEEWCRELDSKPKNSPIPMEVMEPVITITMAAKDMDKDPEVIKMAHETDFASSLMYKRVSAIHSYKITPSALLYLSFIYRVPGTIVEICNYLQYKSHHLGIKIFDVETLSKDIFPFGFFNEPTLQDMWDKQKVERSNGIGSDNLLDYPKFLKSIL